MKTYEFTIHYTHGYADLKVTAASKAQAIRQAKAKAEAFLTGDDGGEVDYNNYCEAGSLETIELDDQTVYEAPDVKADRAASDLLDAILDIKRIADKAGDRDYDAYEYDLLDLISDRVQKALRFINERSAS